MVVWPLLLERALEAFPRVLVFDVADEGRAFALLLLWTLRVLFPPLLAPPPVLRAAEFAGPAFARAGLFRAAALRVEPFPLSDLAVLLEPFFVFFAVGISYITLCLLYKIAPPREMFSSPVNQLEEALSSRPFRDALCNAGPSLFSPHPALPQYNRWHAPSVVVLFFCSEHFASGR